MNKKIKEKNCKVCDKKFTPYRSTQRVCNYNCAMIYASNLEAKKSQKEWKERKSKLKKDLLSHSDYCKILQQLVNRYVKIRDKGLNCISCKKTIKGKTDAGHFFSVGNYPSVRFDERNINSQCIGCNQYNGGNLIEYLPNLINKIGKKEYEDLDFLAHRERKYSIPELKGMIEHYKTKIKKEENK